MKMTVILLLSLLIGIFLIALGAVTLNKPLFIIGAVLLLICLVLSIAEFK